ncbi:hypothetical protein GmHk_06G016303 [Glycine max]|nr:hypothetical protein GmHk_06G016303 [Glycine max]
MEERDKKETKLKADGKNQVGRIKWKFIKQVVVKEEVQLLCIQETKRREIKLHACGALWGDREIE